MSEELQDALYHPEEEPEFAYELGDSLKGLWDDDEYYVVQKRMWDYDADYDDSIVPYEKVHKLYQIGEVAGLGHPTELRTEGELDEHYERVPKEEAKEVLRSDE